MGFNLWRILNCNQWYFDSFVVLYGSSNILHQSASLMFILKCIASRFFILPNCWHIGITGALYFQACFASSNGFCQIVTAYTDRWPKGYEYNCSKCLPKSIHLDNLQTWRNMGTLFKTFKKRWKQNLVNGKLLVVVKETMTLLHMFWFQYQRSKKCCRPVLTTSYSQNSQEVYNHDRRPVSESSVMVFVCLFVWGFTSHSRVFPSWRRMVLLDQIQLSLWCSVRSRRMSLSRHIHHTK